MAEPRNGYVRWPHVWIVAGAILSLGGTGLALHAANTHVGVVRVEEQQQFEKRMVERLGRIEHQLEKQQSDIHELLKRVK